MELSYHGVDLHTNNLINNAIYKSDNGKLIRHSRKVYMNELHTKYIPHLTKNDYVCLEASTGSFSFAKLIKPHVKDVIVINPFDFKALYLSGRKTDKIDAKKLANKLKYHIEANDPDDGFPVVYIPDDSIIELRSLFSTYELYKKQRNIMKNRVHSLLKQNLISYDSDSLFTHFNEIISKLNIKEIDRRIINILYEDIEHYEERMETIKDKILLLGHEKYYSQIKLLIGIPGISAFIACALLADIADIGRFKNAKKFSSYLRSAPKIDSSNETVKNGSIHKKGRKLSFSYVLQGLTHIVNSNPCFADFKGKKMQGKHTCKVRSALIRKTFVTMYYMLKNNTKYKYMKTELFNRKLKLFDKKFGKAA